MQTSSKLILIEFNELSPTLLSRFMRAGHIPSFRAFHDASVVFTTDAGEDPPNLEPWIQWPTVHSGVPFGEHGVFRLGDGRRLLSAKPMGEVLSDAGVAVGVFSSMNTNYEQLSGYVVPDPWDAEGRAHPPSLQPFHQGVSAAVQESSRGLPPKALLGFGAFLLRHGIRPSTVRRAVSQLVRERRQPGLRWRRASVLDDLQYDVFRSLNKRHGVRFATFFSNSTAHYQHYHWRNMEPAIFEVPPPDDDDPSLEEAVLYGYRSMDRLLARFMADEPDALLVLCTGLSQQPWTDTTKCRFRPRSFVDLLAFAGIEVADGAVAPVMAEEFQVELRDAAAAAAAEQAIAELVVDGEQALEVSRTGNRLYAGCRLEERAAEDRDLERSDGIRRRFGDLFYMIHSMRSGRHHRDGALWFRTGQHRVEPGRVPLTDIAPTVLAHFDVPRPSHMKGHPLPIGAPEPSRTGIQGSA